MSESEEMILLPRRVVAALVDPVYLYYLHEEYNECAHCEGQHSFTTPSPDHYDHAASCPVRIAQEALIRKT